MAASIFAGSFRLAGAVNSGLFQMMLGRMLDGNGDLTGIKFTLVNAMKDLRYYTHFTESMMLPSIMGEATHQTLVIANVPNCMRRICSSVRSFPALLALR